MERRIYPRTSWENQKDFRDTFSKFLISKIEETLKERNPNDYMCRDEFIGLYETILWAKIGKMEVEFNSRIFRTYLKSKALYLGLDLDDLIYQFREYCKKNYILDKNFLYDAGLEQEILSFKSYNIKYILDFVDSLESYSAYPSYSERNNQFNDKSKLIQNNIINNIHIYVYKYSNNLSFFQESNGTLIPYYSSKAIKYRHKELYNLAKEIEKYNI
ncbi:hypothetical protein EQZ09_08920 [Clostridium perfringens]|nr:hypothetical protein [Clostridium perfringens]